MNRGICALLGLTLSACASPVFEPAASHTSPAPLDDRFQFIRQALTGENDREVAVSDCTVPDAYCLRSAKAELVVPKSCADLIQGAAFASGGTSSTLLWIDERRGHHGPNRYFWFGNARHPTVLFGYTVEQGVTQIVTAPSGENITHIASEGRLLGRLTTTRDFVQRGRPGDTPLFRCD